MSDLPPGWVSTTVGEVATLTDGPFGSNLKTAHYVDAGPRVIRLQNIGNGVFRDEEAHITDQHFESLRKHEVVPGDVVAASLGEDAPRACLVPPWLGPALVKADCIRIRAAPDVEPGYIMWMLNSPPVRRQAASSIKGVGRPRLGLGGIRQLSLPVPPLNEQRRIVAAIEEQLSRLDAADASLTDASRRASALRNSTLHEAINGAVERPLGDFASIFVGATPSRRRPELWGGGVPWVSSGEVAFSRISKTRETITPDAIGLGDRLHPPGTVLLGMIGEGKTRGQAAILDVAAAHNQNSAAIRLDPDTCTPEWLYYVLMARYEVTRRAGSGGQQPALNRSRVAGLAVPVPPLEEQRRIVARVEEQLSAVDALRAAIERAQRRSATLRRAVLERAFKGKLVPQDPLDEPAEALLTRIRAERDTTDKDNRHPRRRMRG